MRKDEKKGKSGRDAALQDYAEKLRREQEGKNNSTEDGSAAGAQQMAMRAAGAQQMEPGVQAFARKLERESMEGGSAEAKTNTGSGMNVDGQADTATNGDWSVEYGMDAGRNGVIDAEAVSRATQTLLKYKAGKSRLDKRIRENEHWYRMHRDVDAENADSAWMFNSLSNKHADAMDNYPEPNVMPRAQDDQDTAKMLSSVLPVVLEQNRYEQTYSDCWWDKLKNGTSVKGVFWDTEKEGGLGDIDIRRVDLLNLYWEPGVRDIQMSRNLFHVEAMDNETIIERWPFAAGHLGSALHVEHYSREENVNWNEQSVVVDWYYKRGGALHYCKYVGDCVIYASENDPMYAGRGYYDHGKYPFVLDVLYPVSESPAGFGMVDVMQRCQSSIDVMEQAVEKNAEIASRVRYFVRGDGSVNEEEFADLEKDFVHVDGNLGEDSLRQVVVNPLSDIYVTILNNKIQELKETSGNRDYSQGATTNGVTAASAIAALQEAGSKLSRDMLKAAYRSFEQECYLCIELMRQFYTAPRTFRICGENGTGIQFAQFDNKGLMPQPQETEFGVAFGDRLPVFDIRVVPAKKSTYSRLSQNELAKELFGMGLFNPQLADQSLAVLEMMDFDGKDKIVEKISQNQTLYTQLMAAQAQIQQMGAMIDAMTGGQTGIAGNMAQRQEDTANQKNPNKGEPGKTTTDSIGGVQQGESLAVQARRRAQNAANPERTEE